MSLLLIDAGNTRIKWAIHSGDGLNAEFKQQGHTSFNDFEAVLSLPEFQNIDELIYSSVIGEDQTHLVLSACLKALPTLQVQRIQGNSGIQHLPSRYTDASQLGSDRRAMLLGASHLLPNKNLMVIGSGTATTIDFLIEGQHLGGWIVPGFQLMADSLGNNTANLPTINESHLKHQPIALGLTTEHGITQGILASQLGVISVAHQYGIDQHFDIEACVSSGGNAPRLNEALKASLGLTILHEPDLVLKGLLAWKSMDFAQ